MEESGFPRGGAEANQYFVFASPNKYDSMTKPHAAGLAFSPESLQLGIRWSTLPAVRAGRPAIVVVVAVAHELENGRVGENDESRQCKSRGDVGCSDSRTIVGRVLGGRARH